MIRYKVGLTKAGVYTIYERYYFFFWKVYTYSINEGGGAYVIEADWQGDAINKFKQVRIWYV